MEKIVKTLETIALEGGATAIKPISARDVIVAQWVRNKCSFGCRNFGNRFTCPPYAPTPKETADTLLSYHKALLVEFGKFHLDLLKKESALKMVQKVLNDMERTAFLCGYEKAYSYTAGPCALCPECSAQKIEDPNLFHKKECKHPREARPAMEAASIDVYTTVRNAGFELQVVENESQAFKFFGLLLLE